MSSGRLAARTRVLAGVLLASVVVTAGCSPQVLTDTTREVPSPSGSPAAPSTPTPTPIPTPIPTQPADPGSEPPTTGGSVRVLGTVTDALPLPSSMARLPDGTVLVTTREEHHLYRVVPRVGTIVDLGEIPGVVDAGDGAGSSGAGLLGVAVADDYATTKRIYLSYSTPTDNRVAYVTLRPGSPASISDPTVVLSGLPRGERYEGGHLAFGPDKMLYVATADTQPALAQDLDQLGGKILRITPEGSPAPGNPFGDSPVYSYGHRNLQGLAFDPAGRLWATELGDATSDELNWIRPGRNYGWPQTPDAPALPGLTQPVLTLGPESGAPGGLGVLGGAAWVVTLQGERLWRAPLDGTRPAAAPQDFLAGRLGRLRSMVALDTRTVMIATNDSDSARPAPDRLVLVRVS